MRVTTVLTYSDGSQQLEEQLRTAIETADFFGAHLYVAAIACDDAEPFGATDKLSFGARRMRATEEAGEIASRVVARLRTEGIRGDAFPFVTTRATLLNQFDALARYADVVVQVPAPAQEDNETSRSLRVAAKRIVDIPARVA